LEAKVRDENEIKEIVELRKVDSKTKEIKLNHTEVEIVKNRQVQLIVSGTEDKIVFTSDNKKVCNVNKNGLVDTIGKNWQN
jgi:hypothetical protein